MRPPRSLLLLAISLGIAATSAQAVSVVTDWNNVTLNAVRATRFSPPQTARALAIVHTSVYDAWAAYDARADGTQFLGALRRPAVERTEENKRIAISYAAYRALVDLFPTQKTAFDAAMGSLGLNPADTSTNVATPIGIGNVAAAAVLADRRYDGSNQFGDLAPGAYADYTGYAAVNTADQLNDPDRWQPQRFSDGAGGFRTPGFLAPHWRNVQPFALAYASQFRPKRAPARYNDPAEQARYIAQADQVIRLTAALNDRTKAIVEYWADGPASETPPGHWQLFAQFVSERDNFSIDRDAKVFFALGNAELDASIAAWDAKRAYDSARPITAIRFLKAGRTIRTWGGTPDAPATVLGENWKPFQPDTFITPPFAEFVSGHSTFSAASAYILRAATGSDAFGASALVQAGSSRIQPGVVPGTDVTLSWATFSQAAYQAGMSRLYGGIHFQQGNLAGRVLGEKVAEAVWRKSVRYFTGVANPGPN